MQMASTRGHPRALAFYEKRGKEASDVGTEKFDLTRSLPNFRVELLEKAWYTCTTVTQSNAARIAPRTVIAVAAEN